MTRIDLARSLDLGLPRHRSMVLFERGLEVFKMFDQNKDGTIDIGELRRLLQQFNSTWTDDRVERLFKAADLNKDNRIQFEEFLRWCFAGRGEDQPEFRETVGLQDIVQPVVTVTVMAQSGSVAYGPEEILGSFTVGHLRRRVISASECPTGCLCSDGAILRDSMELGVYAQSDILELTQVSDIFTVVTGECISELMSLGALTETNFLGQRCIRIGKGNARRHSSEGEVGRGESHSEFLLLSDGRVLAKAYSYWGFAKSPKESVRTWKYEIAEGTFSIIDPETCFVELHWRKWADRQACDENADGPPEADTLQAWEEREINESNQPHHLVPSCGTSQLNILQLARQVLDGYSRSGRLRIDSKDDPLAGLRMPGINADVLSNLSMDESTVCEKYWRHGDKPAGPHDCSGADIW